MAEANVLERDLRVALDRIVADSLGLVCAVLTALLAFFAVVDPLITPAPWRWEVAITDAVAALLYGAIFLALRRRRIRSSLAHPLGALIALIALANILHDTYLLADPSQTAYMMVLVIATGSMMLSALWLLPVLAATLIGWATVAFLRPGPSWSTFGFALLAASVLAFLVHELRVRTYRRLEALRLGAQRANVERDLREQALEAAVRGAWENEERYRRLVEQTPDAFLVHTEGRVVYANPAAARLLGVARAEDLTGRDAFSFVHPDFRALVVERNRQVEKEGRPTEPLELKIVRLDGTVVEAEVTGQPIQYAGHTADQTIIRDMTDRKRAEHQRRLAEGRLAEIARLQELDRMKTQFVNTLSHELRTPLTPIKVQLHLLKSAHASGDAEKQTRATEMLDRNVTRMGGLIDELLEVARLQAGNLKLDRAPVALDATVAEALESFRDVARQAGVDVEAKLQPGLRIDADARRLTQVMYNLLNNALKFTPRGGRIVVESQREDERAVVRVTDSGQGIKPEDISRLFEPFSQVHDTMQKTNAGTGLGLYICKGIVEGHDGRIWCTSPGLGMGATFAFDLPLVSPENSA